MGRWSGEQFECLVSGEKFERLVGERGEGGRKISPQKGFRLFLIWCYV